MDFQNRKVRFVNKTIAVGIALIRSPRSAETTLPNQEIRAVDIAIIVEVRILGGSADIDNVAIQSFPIGQRERKCLGTGGTRGVFYPTGSAVSALKGIRLPGKLR
ncbi:MAG: hypothetical protein JW829_04295 [Pirellulales bacterium]|nr:hypothetical protein [Pirellulales bacterium]